MAGLCQIDGKAAVKWSDEKNRNFHVADGGHLPWLSNAHVRMGEAVSHRRMGSSMLKVFVAALTVAPVNFGLPALIAAVPGALALAAVAFFPLLASRQ